MCSIISAVVRKHVYSYFDRKIPSGLGERYSRNHINYMTSSASTPMRVPHISGILN
jgi:hypothetical protein